jgi:hypothetical protein
MNAKTPTAAQVRDTILADVHAEAKALEAAKAEHHAALEEIRSRNDQIRADHAIVVLAAAEALKPVPRLPQLNDGLEHREALYLIRERRDANIARRRETLKAALPEIETAWGAARAVLDDRAHKIAAEAELLATEYAGWWELLQEARRAAEYSPDIRAHNGPADRMRPRPIPSDVLVAAQGTDLCGVQPAFRSASLVTGEHRLSDSPETPLDPGPRLPPEGK